MEERKPPAFPRPSHRGLATVTGPASHPQVRSTLSKVFVSCAKGQSILEYVILISIGLVGYGLFASLPSLDKFHIASLDSLTPAPWEYE